MLRCPVCHGTLELHVFRESAGEISDGMLVCSDCAMCFAIWRAVPRMNLEQGFRLPDPFLAEWRTETAKLIPDVPQAATAVNAYDVSWDLDEGNFLWGGLDLQQRVRYFYSYFRVPPGTFTGGLVLDAGCGNGLLSAALAQEGMEVVAFDYSDIVERAERARVRANSPARVHYLQADALHPPFASDLFDAVYSDGVIHLTSDTRASLLRLASTVKPGGLLFVSVSRADLSIGYRIRSIPIDVTRTILAALPPVAGKYACLLAAAFLRWYVRVEQMAGLKRRRKLGTVREEALVLWHMVALPSHRYHSREELAGWFSEAGFGETEDTTIPELGHTGLAMTGIRARDIREETSNESATHTAQGAR